MYLQVVKQQEWTLPCKDALHFPSALQAQVDTKQELHACLEAGHKISTEGDCAGLQMHKTSLTKHFFFFLTREIYFTQFCCKRRVEAQS